MIALIVKSAAVLGIGLVLSALLHRRPAALRKAILGAALLSVLLLPLASAVFPSWSPVALPALEVGGEAAPERAVAPEQWTWNAADAREPATDRVAEPLPAPDATAALVVAWLAVAAFLLGRLAAGAFRARAIAQGARPAGRATLRALANAAADARRRGMEQQATPTGDRRRVDGGLPVALRVSDEVDGPFVSGVVRPVIVLPEAAEAWPAARLRHVLLHELAHVRARDCLVLLVAEVVRALFWFNPLAWIAARELRRLGEEAADDAVLRAGVRPSDYARSLLEVVRVAARPLPAAALGVARPGPLERRLRSLLAAGRPTGPLTRRTLLTTAAVAALVVALVACLSSEQAPPTPAVAATADDGAAGAPATVAVVEPGRGAGAIDLDLQRIVDEESERALAHHRADEVTAVVLDPRTGVVLAARAPDLVVAAASTVKPFLVAAALEEGMEPDARFFCENGRWDYAGGVIEDAGSHGWLDVTAILAHSSNIGAVKIYQRVGGVSLHRFLSRLGFGGLPPRAEMTELRAAHVSLGVGFVTTPVTVASAYGALANGGIWLPPRPDEASTGEGRRVFSEATARTVMTMLEHAVTDEGATGRNARIDGVRVAGKTGTGHVALPDGGYDEERAYATFAGIVPADAPRYVIVIGVVDPEVEATGGASAAPLFARIATRALAR